MHINPKILRLLAFVALLGCADDGSTPSDAGSQTDAGGGEETRSYNFDSRFVDGSSVVYTGQTARLVILEEMMSFIGDLEEALQAGTIEVNEAGDLIPFIDFYFRFDSDSDGEEALTLSFPLPLLQETFNAISAGKDLAGKLAGNDPVTDHRVWTGEASEFSGWADASIAANGGDVTSPEGLFVAFASTLDAHALAATEGTDRLGPGGEVLPVTITASGIDLEQMMEKFLIGALTLSQGADDYMDDDVDGKGLLASHDGPGGDGKPYTALEHAWDEAFGYFGAARDYLAYTDEEIAGKGGREDYADGSHDTNGDGLIDLNAEANFALAVNAAKRDRGSNVATDFTADAMNAFLDGRQLLADTEGPLSEAQLQELTGYRDQALLAWEGALAATVIHYVNDTLQVMNTFGTDTYDFAEHAKVWSEMKGFALGFQFNPHSPLLADFDEIHSLFGDAPVLADGEVDAYRADLIAARALIGAAYGFAAENLGDENGENGW